MADSPDRWRSLSVYAAYRRTGDELREKLAAYRESVDALPVFATFAPARLVWTTVRSLEYAEWILDSLHYDALYLFEYGGTP